MGRGGSKGRGGRGGRSKILHPSFASAGQVASGYSTPTPAAPATPGWVSPLSAPAPASGLWMQPQPQAQTHMGMPLPGTPGAPGAQPSGPSIPMTPNYHMQGFPGPHHPETPMAQPGTPVGYHQYYQVHAAFGPSPLGVEAVAPGTPVPCHFAPAPGTPMPQTTPGPAATPALGRTATSTTPSASTTAPTAGPHLPHPPSQETLESDAKRPKRALTLAEVTEIALDVKLDKPPNLPRIWECSDIVVPRHIEALLTAAKPCESEVWMSADRSVDPPSLQDWADILELVEAPEISGEHFSCPLRELEEKWYGSHRERELMESRGALQAYCDEMLPLVGDFAVEQEESLRQEEALRRQHDWSFERRLLKPSERIIEALLAEDRARASHRYHHH